ncbi:MXAN_6230/SCO0854 family RING domain-containing protein [Streptomyces bambusae]|uniref:RING-type domain-containing protein n=1 Tax=Streptomyces bambusae TaxID=1550616 RepID=A0ABS6ZA86_9ACTN|nr:MXAN_6230/SCO0854 family RING domain-containing protein [Streptomyces bambusae]MBW5484486.1 hypothetical protein [Streptomyces bambusae]
MHATDSVLLRRIQTVYVDPGCADAVRVDPVRADPVCADPVCADPVCADTVHVDRAAAHGHRPGPPTAVRRVEAELLERGYTLSPALHAALAALPADRLPAVRTRLVGLADELLGADRTHTLLFRRFPWNVLRDTERLYVDRVFSHLLQEPEQPCVLCGESGTVLPVSPCAHLVCRLCWDGSDYAGCPVCHRRIGPGDPFLRPAAANGPADGAAKATAGGPLRLLHLGTTRAADATPVVDALLGRRTPLSPQDREDLLTLLPLTPAGRGLLPAQIPVRETKALVVATLLASAPAGAEEAVRSLPGERLDTATDVLRVLAVLSGGDPGLLPLPRFTSLARPLRRELLGVLDSLPTGFLVEDLLRHPTAWKRAAETLHPFERHARHPRAALAFAVLRRTPVRAGTALGDALLETAAAHPDAVRAEGGRIRPATWAGQLEQALAAGDLAAAVDLAGRRPGELVRRLDHLLRLHGDGAAEPAPGLQKALLRGLPSVGPGPLLSALGALRMRSEDRVGRRRVFFPRGQVAQATSVPEQRPPLSAALAGATVALLEAEVLRRFAAAGAEREPYELAVLDAGLADLAVPFAERASAASLVAVPRGSTLTLPEGEVLRLFLHWTEPQGDRTDLDLSVAFFDAAWRCTGLCDYTQLTHGPDRAAVHSGDLTSAPAPDGATEYVDLDLARLAAHGDVYAVPLVFSFNNVPFDRLPDAFAGFMALPADGPRDATYDPRTVRQRFDLAGESRACLPMVVDLAARRALWTDVHLPPSGGFQSVRSHGGRLGEVARDLWEQFGSGTRATLWDLAVWRAAARTGEVLVVRRAAVPPQRHDELRVHDELGGHDELRVPDELSGHDEPCGHEELCVYRRRPAEQAADFAVRIAAGQAPDERRPYRDAGAAAAEVAAGRRVFLAAVRADVAPERASGTSYRLFPGPADAAADLTRVTGGDLVAELG